MDITDTYYTNYYGKTDMCKSTPSYKKHTVTPHKQIQLFCTTTQNTV